jgi:hypothetical protein
MNLTLRASGEETVDEYTLGIKLAENKRRTRDTFPIFQAGSALVG